MRKSIVLIMAMAVVSFASLAANSNIVLADAQHDLIETKVKQTNRIVKGKAIIKTLIDGRYQINQKCSGTFIYGKPTSFPIEIDESGSYVLTSDIVAPAGANCINVMVDNVTLDLNGFSVIGPGTGTTGHGIYMDGRSNVEIRNGTVQGFGLNGIHEASSDGTSHRIINVRAVSNGYDIHNRGIYLNGYNHLVKDCSVVDNANHGISVGNGCTVTGNTVSGNRTYAIGTGSGCTITGNTCYDNHGRGISAGYGCTLINNTCYDNASHGIVVGDSSTVVGNTARSNGDDGIHSVGASLVSENTVHDNGYNGIGAEHTTMVVGNIARYNNQKDLATCAGICVANGCLVKGNTVLNNRQNNIYISGEDSSIEENLVVGTNNGIYFSDTGNFYANNRASGNATNYNDPGGNTDGGGNVSF